jgi:hypothetical protein
MIRRNNLSAAATGWHLASPQIAEFRLPMLAPARGSNLESEGVWQSTM